jgi:hypothetical protein
VGNQAHAVPPAPASTWLGSSAGIPAGGATLAELYALRDGARQAIDRPPMHDGQYL